MKATLTNASRVTSVLLIALFLVVAAQYQLKGLPPQPGSFAAAVDGPIIVLFLLVTCFNISLLVTLVGMKRLDKLTFLLALLTGVVALIVLLLPPIVNAA